MNYFNAERLVQVYRYAVFEPLNEQASACIMLAAKAPAGHSVSIRFVTAQSLDVPLAFAGQHRDCCLPPFRP